MGKTIRTTERLTLAFLLSHQIWSRLQLTQEEVPESIQESVLPSLRRTAAPHMFLGSPRLMKLHFKIYQLVIETINLLLHLSLIWLRYTNLLQVMRFHPFCMHLFSSVSLCKQYRESMTFFSAIINFLEPTSTLIHFL